MEECLKNPVEDISDDEFINSSSHAVPDNRHNTLERKVSKLRLAKQAEIEDVEDCNRSETGRNQTEGMQIAEDERPPISDESDHTVETCG